ncbi:hypothetical protein Dimus_019405 [Dionaea muscipula]
MAGTDFKRYNSMASAWLPFPAGAKAKPRSSQAPPTSVQSGRAKPVLSAPASKPESHASCNAAKLYEYCCLAGIWKRNSSRSEGGLREGRKCQARVEGGEEWWGPSGERGRWDLSVWNSCYSSVCVVLLDTKAQLGFRKG